jgi:hypothetical protein
LRLSPNPIDDYFQIGGAQGGRLYIVDEVGKQVASFLEYNGETVDVSRLTGGKYIAVYGGQAFSFVKK